MVADEPVGSVSSVTGFHIAWLKSEPFQARRGIPHAINLCVDYVL